MSKRAATEYTSPSSKSHKNGSTRETPAENDGMGEFEDAWEDQIEDDDVAGLPEDGVYGFDRAWNCNRSLHRNGCR